MVNHDKSKGSRYERTPPLCFGSCNGAQVASPQSLILRTGIEAYHRKYPKTNKIFRITIAVETTASNL